ncbi:MAG: class II glutamine amidotransferase [Spirochaetes bacterium]|nr:class II glutamine amidotransferase [Spirochaetota bacterium]
MFSDGTNLFCYFDINKYKGLIFVQIKDHVNNNVHLLDDDYLIDLSKAKSSSLKGFIIATNPLNELIDENWETFMPGELIVFNMAK